MEIKKTNYKEFKEISLKVVKKFWKNKSFAARDFLYNLTFTSVLSRSSYFFLQW